MERQQFEALQEQLTKMTKLIALIALSKEDKESEKIRLLDSIGFRPTEIAKILNKTLSNVTTTLTILRKKAHGGDQPNQPVAATTGETEVKASE